MARTLIHAPGLLFGRSLGWLAVWWIENFVLVGGSGSARNDLVRFGDELTGFIVRCYALDEGGYRLHDSAFFSRPKGCNKSGLAAYIALFEAFGPARFVGWAEGGETYTFLGRTYTYEKGEPMGGGVEKPLVRLMATEEGQVGNVYDTVHQNTTEGPLADLKAYGMDAGLTRILLPEGGKIIPSTAGDASKDGGLETFTVADESHLMTTPTLRNMYATVSRNMAKNVQGHQQKWMLETTTMYALGDGSIAEDTFEAARLIQEGKTRRSRLLFDHRYARLTDAEMRDSSDEGEARIREALIESYGDAMEWNDVDAILNQIFDPRSDVGASRRFFFNDIGKPREGWLEPAFIERCAGSGELQPGDQITLGFDGAVSNDATALMAVRVSDGLLVPLRIDECPDGPEALTWTVDQRAFDEEVRGAFEDYDVVAFFADPPYWQDYVDAWERDLGDGLRLKAGKDAVKFWTKHDSYIAPAVERLETDIRLERVIFSDRRDERGEVVPIDLQLRRHFLNARSWERRSGRSIGKESKNSPKKIDAAMASVLAWEARARFLAGAAESSRKRSRFVPMYVRG